MDDETRVQESSVKDTSSRVSETSIERQAKWHKCTETHSGERDEEEREESCSLMDSQDGQRQGHNDHRAPYLPLCETDREKERSFVQSFFSVTECETRIRVSGDHTCPSCLRDEVFREGKQRAQRSRIGRQ